MILRLPPKRNAVSYLLLSGVVCCAILGSALADEKPVPDLNRADSNIFHQACSSIVACLDHGKTNDYLNCFVDQGKYDKQHLEVASSNGLFSGSYWNSALSEEVIDERKADMISGRLHWHRLGLLLTTTVLGPMNEATDQNFACHVELVQVGEEWKVLVFRCAPTGYSAERLKKVAAGILQQKDILKGRNVASQEVASAYFGIGYLHLSVGRLDEAEQAARQSVAASENVMNYFLLGRVLKAKESFGEARDAFTAAAKFIKEGQMLKDATNQALECSILFEKKRSAKK